jgi:hypothetical protein
MNQSVRNSARLLASGTIASLIHSGNYNGVSSVHEDFIRFCDNSTIEYETWQQAWSAYFDNLPVLLDFYKVVKSQVDSAIAYYLIGKKTVYRLVRSQEYAHVMFVMNDSARQTALRGYSLFTDVNGFVAVW